MDRVQRLQQHFEQVSVTMAELPVFNASLAVATVGFQSYQDGLLGILLTPWCMNLVLLPSTEKASCSVTSSGSKQMLSLPSGQYEFIWGHVETLGEYQSCSLFSPMFEFESQAQATEIAEEVMKALFEAENYTPSERQQLSEHSAHKTERMAGEATEKQSKEIVQEELELSGDQTSSKLSRRNFLRGNLRSSNNRTSNMRNNNIDRAKQHESI